MGVELGSGGVGGLRPAPRSFLISSEPGWSRPICPRSPERTGYNQEIVELGSSRNTY